MLISDIISESLGLLSRQLKFYCWHYKRDLDTKQQQELLNLLDEHYFEKLASKIKQLNQSNINDSKQQIAKLLFERCFSGHRRNQLIQLIESDLVDINVRLDNYGRTLLHRTAYNLDVHLVKLLIDHGVNIKLRDYAGNTALHIAIQSYRNGALIYNNEPEVVQNLTSIIELLLKADNGLQLETALRKRIKLDIDNANIGDVNSPRTNHPLKPAHGHSKINSQSQQPDTQGTKQNLVLQQNSPTNNDTICRIIGASCPCRKQNFDKKSNESTINRDPRNSESQESKVPVTKVKQCDIQNDCIPPSPRPLMMEEDRSVSLIDTKNAFGRTALHYCVLVVGERHLDHFVRLLVNYGADVDVVDTRLKTPLYCLVKRPGVSAIRQKFLAIAELIDNGCDDLGLALEQPRSLFGENLIKSVESNIAETLSKMTDEQYEPIFTRKGFKRVPSLKHLARLELIRMNDLKNGRLRRQTAFWLPQETPNSLKVYVNRKILDQSELF